MPRLRAPLALVALAAVLLAGCSSPTPHGGDDPASPSPSTSVPLGELALHPDPRNVDGPATATVSDAAIVPVDAPAEPALPTTVISHERSGEQKIEITDASAVLALDLSGSLAATVWGLGLGDRLVGRDVSTTFPGTEELPLVTAGGHSINAEAVLALRPSLIITDGSIGPRDVLEQLRQAGVTLVFLENESSFAGAAQLARDVAAVLGVPEAGAALADRITSEVAATRAEIEAIIPAERELRPRAIFLYIRGGSGVYYLFGEGSGAAALIEGLGAIDVASETGWVGERPMTDEALIAADPDVILVMTGGLESAGGVDALLASKPAIALTHAGQNRRIVDMADGAVLGFGPRSAQILDALARAVYALPEPAAAG